MSINRKERNELLERENAVAALGGFIENGEVTRGGMYLAGIINTLVQNGKEILKRYPPNTFGGLADGGRRNVIAAALCRADEAASGRTPKGSDPQEESERLERTIESWARRDGCWSEDPDQDTRRRCPFIGTGAEANVYRLDGSTVIKVVSNFLYENPREASDRIVLHNALFPETAMRVTGFGRFCTVVTQPFVEGTNATDEDIEKLVSDLGMRKLPLHPETQYASPEIYLGDLHDENVIRTPKGNAAVIDCEARINTPSLDYGGKYAIPEPDFDPEAVGRIEMTVRNLLPESLGKDEVSRRLRLPEKEAAAIMEQLEKTGRTDGPVPLGDGNYILQTEPDVPGRILCQKPENIARLLSFGIQRLDDGTTIKESELRTVAAGGSFVRNGTHYAFNLDRGRIDETKPFQRKLRIIKENKL